MNPTELSTLVQTGSKNRTRGRYYPWSLTFIVLAGAAIASLIFQQKLQNDQIELAQPDGSLVFEGNLASLPTFGQTFVPRQAGLRGIYIPISVEAASNSNGALTLHLRSAPEATEDLRTVTLPLAELKGQKLARFSFQPLPASFNTHYYFFLEPVISQGDARVKLRYGGANAYLDGSLHVNSEPQDFQASFFLAYDRWLMIRDWTSWLVNRASSFIILLLLLVFPGGALLAIFKPNYELDWVSWLIFSMGLSLASFPLLLLWGTRLGVRFNFIFVWTLILISGGVISWQLYQKYRTPRPSLARLLNLAFKASNLPINFVLVLLILFLFFTRFVPIRGLEIPMWQDSYHHTVISSLIAEQGQLIDSWLPYAPLKTFTVHYGFHTLVVFFHWATGLEVATAVIVIGQILNVLAVLSLYPLAIYIGGGKWSGLGAMVIAGFITTTPIVYTNWGRYPQLASQVLLPLTIYAMLFVLEKIENRKVLFLIAAILIGGMSLTYYRTAFNFLVFVLVYSGIKAYWHRNELGGWVFKYLKNLSFVTVISLVMIFPWLIQVFEGKLPLALMLLTSQQVKPPATFVQGEREGWLALSEFIPPFVLALSLLTWLLGLLRRWLLITILGLWALILTLPSLLGLPASGLVFPGFGTRIFIYIPLSVMVGYLFGKIAHSNFFTRSATLKALLTIVIVGAIIWGSSQQLTLINLSSRLVTKPDLAAAAWIKENIPAQAKFLVNSKITNNGWVTGTDAGLWLPILTNRDTTVPPEYYINEVSIDPDYPTDILNLSRKIGESSTHSETLVKLLRSEGVTHVYIGQRQGLTPYSPEALLKPEQFINSPFYELLYHQDHVWIFALKKS